MNTVADSENSAVPLRSTFVIKLAGHTKKRLFKERKAQMKASQGKLGRIFVLRLEDGDVIPGCIERFAEEKGILAGYVTLLGGIGSGQIVAGPKRSEAISPQPIVVPIKDAYEMLGVGVLAPNKEGKPILHLHTALGREEQTITGDPRYGITLRLVGEVILHEISNISMARIKDEQSGLSLLEIE